MKKLFFSIMLLICTANTYSSEAVVDYRSDFGLLPMRNQDIGNCYSYAAADFMYWYLTQVKGMHLTSGVSPIAINWNYHKYDYMQAMEERIVAKGGKLLDEEMYSDEFAEKLKENILSTKNTKSDFAQINTQEGGTPLRIHTYTIFLDEHIRIGSCAQNVNEELLYNTSCNLFNQTYDDYETEKQLAIKLFDTALPTFDEGDVACMLGKFEQCKNPKDELFSCILNDSRMPRIELDYALKFKEINENFYKLPTSSKVSGIDQALYESPVYIAYDSNILDPNTKFFFNAFYDLFEDNSTPTFNHASLLVGMTNDEYILRNSWGKDSCNERLTFLENFIAETKRNAQKNLSEADYKLSTAYNMQSPFYCDSNGNFIIDKQGLAKSIGYIFKIEESDYMLRSRN